MRKFISSSCTMLSIAIQYQELEFMRRKNVLRCAVPIIYNEFGKTGFGTGQRAVGVLSVS